MYLAILVSICLVSSLVSAATLYPPSPPPNNTPRIPQSLSTPFIPSNITNASTQPPNVLRIQCDSIHYGHNLSPHSCHDVFNYLAKSDEQNTFSERHTARPNDVPLPWRVVSNDGLCFVQALLLRGAVKGHASPTQVGQAAYTLFQRCVVDKGVGAIAANIGGDNHLNVVIADYAPNVRCDRTATPGPPWDSCLAIVADMLASKNRRVFGDRSQDPRVEVHLPTIFKATDARCQASVEITGKSTSASWYEIWEAMSALSAMCVRTHGKGGKAIGLGLRKNIFIQMSDESPDLSQPAATTVNVSASASFLGLEAYNASSEVNETEWAPDPSFETSTSLVQGSSSVLVFPGNATSDTSEGLLA